MAVVGYQVTYIKIDRKTNKPEKISIRKDSSFKNFKEAYADLLDLTDGIGMQKTWIAVLNNYIYDYYAGSYRVHPVKQFWHKSEKYDFEVDVNIFRE